MRFHLRMAIEIELGQKQRYNRDLREEGTGIGGKKKEPTLYSYLLALYGKSETSRLQKEEEFEFERANGGLQRKDNDRLHDVLCYWLTPT